ncbi:MerR family transcriptional regulator [Candidatus Enterococcus ferrettii]|uniref:HTH merR-type domain-containing protein n=1 Tax=Candidatus Enterococcus ferrettii TaxID=2815324 RepID=A0ABV0EUK9_9ENTE|nr:MerR family transcriptional regulator [Enterococcus sp. 665A]MBO1339375.1 MerR family transcriptional regulator [Enterococcus sp. 665A]
MIYHTSEVAKLVGLHPNTIRRYEEWELIPKPQRAANGYRIFTQYHIELIRLAQVAFQIEVLQSGLRRKMVDVIKALALYDFSFARQLILDYQYLANHEIAQAHEAIEIVEGIIRPGADEDTQPPLTRSEAADYLEVTVDALRNWELNGLLMVKRRTNRYRIYNQEDLKRLKIIRTLRGANYSLEAILRLLLTMDQKRVSSIKEVLNTPEPDEDIIAVCDQLLTSLEQAKKNAEDIMQRIDHLEETAKITH